MPLREDAPLGAPCWVDLFTSDADRTQEFYCELFGWTAEAAGPEYGGYVNFSKDGARVAGSMRNDGSSGMPDVWSVYLAVDDAEATVAAAVARAGSVIVPPMAVGPLGTMAVVTDPGQAAIGMWRPGLHKGFGILGETGAPSWFELHTRDFAATVQFYRDVFKWDAHTMSDTPEFRYTTLGKDENALAGVMDGSAYLPEGVHASWSVYFGVDDTDKALARIADLGGSVLEPAQDTPYGRLARAADPTGAAFKIGAGM